MFVYDLHFSGHVIIFEWTVIHNTISSFGRASSLWMNGLKSILIHNGIGGTMIKDISLLFGVGIRHIDEGLSYLGFNLKPKNYCTKYWDWLVDRFHKKLDCWKHRWLTMGGRTIMLKFVLQNIAVY